MFFCLTIVYLFLCLSLNELRLYEIRFVANRRRCCFFSFMLTTVCFFLIWEQLLLYIFIIKKKKDWVKPPSQIWTSLINACCVFVLLWVRFPKKWENIFYVIGLVTGQKAALSSAIQQGFRGTEYLNTRFIYLSC